MLHPKVQYWMSSMSTRSTVYVNSSVSFWMALNVPPLSVGEEERKLCVRGSHT